MSSNLHRFRVFQRLAVTFLLCLAIFGCEGKNVLTVLGPGGGGGTPNPGDPDPLTVVNHTPGITEDASTTTHIIIQFDRAPTEASLTGRVELRYINEVNGTQNLVPLTRNATFDGFLDGSIVIYDQMSPPLEAFTHTTNTDGLGRKQYYQLSILAGITAADGGMLETTLVHDFGTGSEDIASNFPASIEINGDNPFPSMLPPAHFYSNEADLEVSVTGSGDVTAPVLMILNADNGGATPGDFAIRYTPGGQFITELITIPNAPTNPGEVEYAITLTAYDASFNVASKTFTFTYDTLAPDAPTMISRSDGMADSDPVSATTLDVDVMFSAAPSPTGAYEVQVSGGLMPTPVELVLANPQTDISVMLRRNQNNSLRAVAFDAAGNPSAPSTALVITQDDLPPSGSVQWIPALALNTTNIIKQSTVKAQVSITSMELVTIEVHSDDSMSNPIATKVVGGPITAALDVDLAFVAPLDPPVTNLTVFISDGAGNAAEFGPYTVRVDLSVNPEPTITRLCDANGPCLPVGTAMGECAVGSGMVARSSSCVQYDVGAPGGYRTALSNVFAFGTVEAGSILRFIPPGGLFVNGAADPTSDVFPADGSSGPTIRAVASGGRFDIAATDTAGNQFTTVGDAQLVTDRSAPDAPAFTGAASDGMTCMLSASTSDPVFDVVLLLEGPFTGDCDGLSMDFDLTDSTDNPDRSLGESLLARVTTDMDFESSAAAPAVPPMAISASVTGITLPASYENAISEFTASTVDAVGNVSDAIRVAVIHRTDSETVIPASVEMLTNSGGDHGGEALSFSVVVGPPDIINSRPTNATSVVIDGRTDPAADDVELLDNLLQPFMTPVTDLPDTSTGAFSLTTPAGSFSTDGTYTFYVRTTRTTMMGTQTEDVRVNIIYDTTGPTTTPSAQITAPQGGSTAPVAIAVANLADTTGLNQVELVARRYSDSGCTMAVALPMGEVCESTLTTNEACAALDPADPSYVALTASIGDYVEVLFRDESGNESTNSFPPRLCLEVPTSRRFAALVKDALPANTGINFFNIDETDPVGTLVTDALLTGPEQIQVYSPTRMFILDRAGGNSSVVHYSLDTATVEAAPPTVAGTLGQMVARADRQVAVFLQSGLTESSVLAATVDGSQNITTLGGSNVVFPGFFNSNKISTNMELFPASADPQSDWAIVVRADGNLLVVPPAAGDAIIFDLSDGSVVTPTGGFVVPSAPGLSVGPVPTDILIRSDGYYALVANNTGLDGDTNAAEDDLTVLDFSACTAATPGNCTTANFGTTKLAIQDGAAVAVNGLAGLVFLPGSDTEALAVEPLSGDASGGRLHLITIDWAMPSVTVDATINLGVALKAALSVTDDGSEAFVLANSDQTIFRVEIDTMAPSLTLVAEPAGTLEPNPGTATFKASFAPLP